MPHGVHAAAAAGYQQAAETYARARPGYPAAAVDWLLERLEGEIVEIGAGTGKLTDALVARGARVAAVEPVAAMRARLARLGPAVRPIDATAERLPFPAGGVASAVASQSLHWTDVDASLRELDRVLAPGGALALLWNLRDLAAPWQGELDALLAGLRGDAPHSRDGRWESAVERSSFTVGERSSWRWAHETDPEGVVARVRSVSYVAALPEPRQQAVDAEVRALLARHGLDTGAVAFPYVTEAYLLRRRR